MDAIFTDTVSRKLLCDIGYNFGGDHDVMPLRLVVLNNEEIKTLKIFG